MFTVFLNVPGRQVGRVLYCCWFCPRHHHHIYSTSARPPVPISAADCLPVVYPPPPSTNSNNSLYHLRPSIPSSFSPSDTYEVLLHLSITYAAPPHRATPPTIKHFLLNYRGNDLESTTRVVESMDGPRMDLSSQELYYDHHHHHHPPWTDGWMADAGPQISDAIQSLKSAEHKWITLS